MGSENLKIGDWVRVTEICDHLPDKSVNVGKLCKIGPDSNLSPNFDRDGVICLWPEGARMGTFCKVVLADGECVPAETKATNPKDAIGTRKVPYSCVPSAVVSELSLAFLEGACKYGRHNYREAGVRASVYFDAAKRHLDLFWEGQDIDPDSGLPHITKALACLTVLRDAQMNDKCTDDRPPAMADPHWMAKLNKLAGEVLDRFPNPLPPVTNQLMNEKAKSVLQ